MVDCFARHPSVTRPKSRSEGSTARFETSPCPLMPTSTQPAALSDGWFCVHSLVRVVSPLWKFRYTDGSCGTWFVSFGENETLIVVFWPGGSVASGFGATTL